MNAKDKPASGSTTLVIVALGLALLAVVLTNIYIGMVRSQADADSITVYTLTRTVYPGEKLDDDDIEPKQFPGDFDSTFSNRVKPESLQLRIDTVIRRTAEQGSPLTHDLFTEPEDREIDLRITPGMRLYALPVNNRTVPGNLRPGMIVDLEAPFRVGGKTLVIPVLEQVKVMAVGRRDIADESNEGRGRSRPITSYDTISIELTPLQATQMSMIQRMTVGDFDLHLRNPSDRETPKIPRGGINERLLEMLPDTLLPEGANVGDDLETLP